MPFRHPYSLLWILPLLGLSCAKKEPWETVSWDALHEDAQRLPEYALAGMEVHEGLEVELFAHEPMLTNPTNIAVDARGRVWVCEAINYRLPFNPTMEERAQGDRILILEDTDQDGKADKKTVFFQGPEVNAALGITVLGPKVIVSHSPSIMVLTDTDGDDVADQLDTLFTGIGGPDDDHGAHAVKFGPDGRLYFNFGNAGGQLLHKDGSPVLDQEGRPVRNQGKPYWQGMVFRCDPDGSNVEVLGHNFRNIYELDVDPYGTIWQTDNDDDGNRGCRVNYVMEYGNFGYRDEVTGAGWREPRPGMHEEIPKRHWHLNDPGVVPNVLQTGAGSPAGIAYYRGDLLPEVFRGEVLHAEALHNVVRAYPAKPQGAGYRADLVNLLKSKDQWFRPSDVEVAPDGSVFIADWYDAGVGGNKMDDAERGRIYRVAPQGDRYAVPAISLSDPAGAVEALCNPNMDRAFQGWTYLARVGQDAEPALRELWSTGEGERRAQALWLLARLPRGQAFLSAALTDPSPDIRIAALRAARLHHSDSLGEFLTAAVRDEDPSVRREAALALRYYRGEDAPRLWSALAGQYDGADRWYLEALGIGADKRADSFFRAWWHEHGEDAPAPVRLDIIWRMRADTTLPLLADLIADGAVADEELPRYFRAFHFKDPQRRDPYLARFVGLEDPRQPQLAALALGQISPAYVERHPAFRRQLRRVLPDLAGTSAWLDAVESMRLTEQMPQLLDLYERSEDPSARQRAMRLLLDFGGSPMVQRRMTALPPADAHAFALGLGQVAHPEAARLLARRLESPALPRQQRIQLVEALGTGWDGQHLLYDMVRDERLHDETLVRAAAVRLMNCWNPEIRSAAEAMLTDASAAGGTPLPQVMELVARSGDPARGREVFSTFCQTCHQVDGAGVAFGPDLSRIGDKLAKKALYSSILFPSAGINFGYEGYVAHLDDGEMLTGILVSETDQEVTLRLVGGADRVLARSNVDKLEPMDRSLMTANLHAAMTEQELVDLVEYLVALSNGENET